MQPARFFHSHQNNARATLGPEHGSQVWRTSWTMFTNVTLPRVPRRRSTLKPLWMQQLPKEVRFLKTSSTTLMASVRSKRAPGARAPAPTPSAALEKRWKAMTRITSRPAARLPRRRSMTCTDWKKMMASPYATTSGGSGRSWAAFL